MPVAIKGEKGSPHKYDIAEVHAWNVKRKSGATQKDPRGQVINYEKERSRLIFEQADARVLENAQLRGELIPFDRLKSQPLAAIGLLKEWIAAMRLEAVVHQV